MPDGDIVHPLLSSRYQQLYQEVCEGQCDEDALARDAIRLLKKEIEAFGDEPLFLIAQEVPLFESIFLIRQQGQEINWAHERRKVKQLRQSVDGHPRALDLVVKACEEQLRDLEMYECERIAPPDFEREITRQYFSNIYDAQFAGRAAQLRQPPGGADLEFVRQRLGAMRPGVINGLASYIEQTVQNRTVKGLRRPPSSPQRKINYNEDLDKDLSEL
jgi:hypothetical protein